MIKHILTLLLLISTLFSCYNEGGKDQKKPDTLLSFDEMTEILTDIQLAEGIITYNRTTRENNTNKFKDSLYSNIFHHYGITAATFKENINYYNSDPTVMEEIFDVVLANLSKEQSQIEMEAAEKAKLDEEEELNTKNDTIKQ